MASLIVRRNRFPRDNLLDRLGPSQPSPCGRAARPKSLPAILSNSHQFTRGFDKLLGKQLYGIVVALLISPRQQE